MADVEEWANKWTTMMEEREDEATIYWRQSLNSDVERKLNLLKTSAKLVPYDDYFLIEYLRGLINYGRYKECIKYANKSLIYFKKSAKRILIYYYIGRSLFLLREFSKSLKPLEKSNSIFLGRFQFSLSLYKLKKFEKAIKEFNLILENENFIEKLQKVDLLNAIGATFYQMGKLNEAIESFKNAILIRENNFSYFGLAIIFIHLKEFKNAKEMIEKGLINNNNNNNNNNESEIGFIWNGVLVYKIGEYQNAINNFNNENIQIDSLDNFDIRYYYHALSLLKLKQLKGLKENNKEKNEDEILEKFQASINTNFDNILSKIYYKRGKYFLLINQIENAKEDFLNAIKFNSKSAPIYQLSNSKIASIEQQILLLSS